VVLSLHVGLLPAALAAARVDGARLGLIAHGTEVWAPMSGRQRRMVQRCDRVLAVSSFTAHWVTRRAALEPGRVRRLWLPIDEGLATRAGQVRPRGPSNEIVTVSRLDPEHRYKGHFDIAESLPRVLERCPDARWNIVGVGDDLPALRARCRDLGIGEAARFLGSLSDSRLAETYATAAALVLPSTADVSTTPPEGEGFGLVFAEAAAFGVPSIASAQGGGSVDLVVDGQTGLTVPPQDPAGLAAAILRLLEDRSLRDRLGEGARALVRERHTSERFSEALVAGLS
jgi:phosphatidylinositol alpha-1,6-mannosyltransferase